MILEDTEIGAMVKEELIRGWYAEAALAKGRQLRIAEANARLEHAHIEGVGQHVASIDAFSFIDWERRHPGITRDPDWLKSLLRDNPECRVKSQSAKTQVSFAGLDFNPSEPSGICPDGLTNVNEDENLTLVNPPVGTAGPAVRDSNVAARACPPACGSPAPVVSDTCSGGLCPSDPSTENCNPLSRVCETGEAKTENSAEVAA